NVPFQGRRLQAPSVVHPREPAPADLLPAALGQAGALLRPGHEPAVLPLDVVLLEQVVVEAELDRAPAVAARERQGGHLVEGREAADEARAPLPSVGFGRVSDAAEALLRSLARRAERAADG